MILEKQCKTCEFNFNGVCVGHGDTYKHGDKIIDETKSCNDWGASVDYFTYTIVNAPRFLREPLIDCKIQYSEFLKLLDNYFKSDGISINFFDAVKYIYGISMVDIAVLLNVSFGVVYRAKTRGIPAKRLKQFSEILCVPPELLTSTSTHDFDKLQKGKKAFFSRPNIEQRLTAMPEWKKKLAHELSSVYLNCPLHIAKELARIDKIYWTKEMSLEGLTGSEEKMITFITRRSKKHQPVINLEYSLDIACKPHVYTKETIQQTTIHKSSALM